MPRFEAVLFDLDDTLTMSEPACYEMENAALIKQGQPPMQRQVHIDTWGKALPEVISERSPGVDVKRFWPDLLAIHAEWIANGEIDQIPESNVRILNTLGHAGVLLAVLTNRTFEEAKHFLEDGHVLKEIMREIYHSDSTGFRKPDPRVFDLFFQHHPHIARESVAYVGDAPSDEEAVYNAGLGHAFITLESGLRVPDNFKGGDKTTFIRDLSELPDNII